MRRLVPTPAPLVLVLAACSLGPEAAPPPSPSPAPPAPAPTVPGAVDPVVLGPGGEQDGWRLRRGRGPTGAVPVGDRVVTLFVRPGRLGGFGGCNAFGVRARVENGRVRVRGPITSTLKGCGDEILALERAYMSALREVTTIERTPGRLVLRGPGTRLEFEPCRLVGRGPACELLGGDRR